MTPHPVLIEWDDAADVSPAQWIDPEEVTDEAVAPCGIVSVGWLVHRSESAVLLALSVSEVGDLRGAFVVPTACIRRLVALKIPGRPK